MGSEAWQQPLSLAASTWATVGAATAFGYLAWRWLATPALPAGVKPLPRVPEPWPGILQAIPTFAKFMKETAGEGSDGHMDSAIVRLAEAFPDLGKLFVIRLGFINMCCVLDADAAREVSCCTIMMSAGFSRPGCFMSAAGSDPS